MTKLKPTRNVWQVRDADGLVHTAQVLRFFDEDDDSKLVTFQVSTACHPASSMVQNVQRLPWVGQHLPAVDLYKPGTHTHMPIPVQLHFTIVEWNVREVTTCIQCAALGGFD